MAPAFSNLRQAVGFGLLLLATILLPAWGGRTLLPDRKEAYSSVSWGAGAFPCLREQIFDETSDIDIAFMGSSATWWGIDTPAIQSAVSEKLGRPAVVRSLCWNWNGFDAFYFICRDLLAHRKVRMLVMHVQTEGIGNTAHAEAPNWFRYGDDAETLHRLPFRSQGSFYGCAILGMPRNLLGMLRSNLEAVPSKEIAWTGFSRVPNPMGRNGSLAVPAGWGCEGTFREFVPPFGHLADEVETFPGDRASSFRFTEKALYPMQAVFVELLVQLLEKNGVKVVFLQMPHTDNGWNPFLEEDQFWPAEYRDKVTWLGIPQSKLFAGMGADAMHNLFHDWWHMNANGQRYFSSIITPALIRIYQKNDHR